MNVFRAKAVKADWFDFGRHGKSLVLSSFTGASRELSEALIVNPYDTEDMASAFERALTMPADEQAERMKLMRQQVKEHNVYRWAGAMLVDAARSRTRERVLGLAANVSAGSGRSDPLS